MKLIQESTVLHVPHCEGPWGDSMLALAYSHKLLRKIKVAICNYQADGPFYLWLIHTLNVLSETRCH